MASKKKASEGIALLSMYGDEDDEMEGAEEQDENIQEEEIPSIAPDVVMVKDEDEDDLSAFGNENASQQEERGLNAISPNKLFNYGTSSATASPLLSRVSPRPPQHTVGLDLNLAHVQKNRLTIVDYGHEEGAMSPEAEDGEIVATGRVMYGEQVQTSDGEFWDSRSPRSARLATSNPQTTTPQLLDAIDQPESDSMNCAINASESAETEDAAKVSTEEQRDMDPLDKFLPPPPKEKCSEELQEKIIKFLALKKTTGRSFNAEVRNKKEYRNPDFLLHAVTYQNIDQIGSCFSKDVFDPHGYDKSDFYDEIEADIRREVERREQEKKKNPKVDFVSGGMQQGIVIPTPKIHTPIPGLTAVAGGVSNITPVAVDIAARDGRHNKKSKWMLIKGILIRLEVRKLCLLLVLMQPLSLLLKLVVDTLLLRNKGERRQKIGDPVKENRRKDRSIDSFVTNIYIHIKIAGEKEMKGMMLEAILNLYPSTKPFCILPLFSLFSHSYYLNSLSNI